MAPPRRDRPPRAPNAALTPGSMAVEREPAVHDKCTMVVVRDGAVEERHVDIRDTRTDAQGQKEFLVHFVEGSRSRSEWVLGKFLVPVGKLGGRKRPRELSGLLWPGMLGAAATPPEDEAPDQPNVETISIGRWVMRPICWSPFPCLDGKKRAKGRHALFACEFCLKTDTSQESVLGCCALRHPPGNEIYREDALSIFEVDGGAEPAYCQRLCRIARLFLEPKVVTEEVHGFRFYVLGEWSADGCQLLGYFSKEKASVQGNNLACVLVLPPHQRRGYGTLLISLSYELTKREHTVGHPERPLSVWGDRSYRSFWTASLVRALYDRVLQGSTVSIDELSRATGIRHEDVSSTLHDLDVVTYQDGEHSIQLPRQLIAKQLQSPGAARRGVSSQGGRIRGIDVSKLLWQPATEERQRTA